MRGQDFQGKGKGIQTAAKSPIRLPLGALNTDELNYSAGSGTHHVLSNRSLSRRGIITLLLFDTQMPRCRE